MKKFLSIVLVIIALCSVSACSLATDKLSEIESGYYKYVVETAKDGTERAYLTGFTETGLEQASLVFPEEIDSIKVYGVGYLYVPLFGTSEVIEDFRSEKLERLYFPFSYGEVFWNDGGYLPDTYLVKWYKSRTNPSIPSKGTIVGWELYKSDYVQNVRNANNLLANIIFNLNYENSPNGGEYWVDSYDKSKITYQPPEPIREGYKFCGWYKEKECLNAWDFDNDMTGHKLVIEKNNQYKEYNGTVLYAKWDKIKDVV